MGEVQKMQIDGKQYILIPEDDYEDMLDVVHARAIVARREESFPTEVAKALVEGVHPVRVFRQHRAMTMAELAAKAGVTQPAIAGIESGRRVGRPATMKAIAAALGVGLDDIA